MIYISPRNGSGDSGLISAGGEEDVRVEVRFLCHFVLTGCHSYGQPFRYPYPLDVFDCDSSFSQGEWRAIQRNTESVHVRVRVFVCVCVCVSVPLRVHECVCV